MGGRNDVFSGSTGARTVWWTGISDAEGDRNVWRGAPARRYFKFLFVLFLFCETLFCLWECNRYGY
jgi:hypothetical protein